MTDHADPHRRRPTTFQRNVQYAHLHIQKTLDPVGCEALPRRCRDFTRYTPLRADWLPRKEKAACLCICVAWLEKLSKKGGTSDQLSLTLSALCLPKDDAVMDTVGAGRSVLAQPSPLCKDTVEPPSRKGAPPPALALAPFSPSPAPPIRRAPSRSKLLPREQRPLGDTAPVPAMPPVRWSLRAGKGQTQKTQPRVVPPRSWVGGRPNHR